MISRAAMRLRAGRAGLAALGLFLLGASTCFGPPVVERLRIEPLAGGKVRVTARVELAAGESRNPRVARRLGEWREAITAGTDPWSRRFAELSPAEERLVWERKGGELVAAERVALLDDPGALQRLFADSPVTVAFDREPGTGELVFTPGAGSRASRSERQEVELRVAAWTAAVASYLQAVESLHRGTSSDPARERRAFGVLFGDEAAEAGGPLPSEDQARVTTIDESMGAIIEALSVTEGEADSLEERTRLVFDPFPAPVEVAPAGRILDLEGFERGPGGVLTVPGLSLWGALPRLAESWPALTPFVDAARERSQAEEETEIDPDAFVAALAASEPAPAPHELAAALARRLTPAPVYRVRWAFTP